MELQFGIDVIRSYKRLSYTPWHAFAEFVDNSTQSYFNNRALLDEALHNNGERLEVSIVYDRESGLIRIVDNSIGMSESELAHALRVGARPIDDSGRSQFGMGLKTAACWFGDVWTVRTKRLGETTEIKVEVDVERVANGDILLPTTITEGKNANEHYTIIEISRLNRKFQGRTVGKIKDFLQSMYRVDLREEVLDLKWQLSSLVWNESDDRFLIAADGAPYKRSFDFAIGGKRVHGWVGVLKSGIGVTGRPHAGFSIIRRGRVIKGYPENWRPESIFGQLQGSNDLVNQRVTGEIHLDAFEVSHTKDDILWMEDEESEIQEQIKQIAADFVAVVKQSGRRDNSESGPSDVEVKAAVDELSEEISSAELADLIDIDDVPPPEVVDETLEPMREAAEGREPDIHGSIGRLDFSLYTVIDGSPNDPYVTVDSPHTDRVVVIVNMRHPFIQQLEGSEGVLNYLRHCAYDAIAEWQAMRVTTQIDPDTVKILKDRLLRVPWRIRTKGN